MTGTIVEFIGGEMFAWSDEDPSRSGPLAGGGALSVLASRLVPAGARVLVAGPHRRELVTGLLDGGAAVSWLVRSQPDADAIAAALAGHGALTVRCGDLSKLTTTDGYDVVIALDGVARLGSAEGGAPLSWVDAVRILLTTVRPGGAVLLGTPNPVGLHRLVAMTPWYAGQTDADWLPVAGRDTTAPAGLSALLTQITALGLRVGKVHLGYAGPAAPSVVISRYVARGPLAVDGHLDAVVAAACQHEYAGRPVLADPGRLATDALRASAAAELAPLWIVTGTVPGDPALEVPAVPDTVATADTETPGAAALRSLPDVVVAGGDAASRWDIPYEIVPDESNGWTRCLLPNSRHAADIGGPADGPAVITDGVLRRDPGLLASPLPGGLRLVDLVTEHCLARDVPALRATLTGYASWLTEQADMDGTVPRSLAFAVPGNVCRTGSGYALLDPSWQAEQRQPARQVLLRGLRQVAVTLTTAGYSHPWPARTDADGLTIILAGLAGHQVDRAAVADAVTAEVALEGARRGLTGDELARFAARLADVSGATPPLDVDSHQELRAASDRQLAELTHLRDQIQWYEQLLSSREAALRRAERSVELFSGTPSYRVARLAVRAVRKAGRVPGGLRRRWRARTGKAPS